MSDSGRNLEPTARRRQRARAEGHVAASPQVAAAGVWLAMSLSLWIAGDAALSGVQAVFVHLWQVPWIGDGSGAASYHSGAAIGAERLREAILLAASVALPAAGVCFVSALVSRLAQVGYVWAPQRLLPETGRLAPQRRWAEFFSTFSIFQLLRAAGTSSLACFLLGWGLWAERESLARLLVVPAGELPALWLSLVSTWTSRIALCLVAFAALDYVVQRYRYEVNLRMSPEEMRAEIQAIQGNPQIAAGRRHRRRHMRQEG